MAYRYGIKNTYRPSSLAPTAYGWNKGWTYNSADVPSQWVDTQNSISTEVLRQQFAYEWFQSGDQFAGFTGEQGLTNPPFVSGAAGRLHPLLVDASGKPARILRGYIRRAEYDVTDNLSKARLYFMYNPETITRDYVSYLEQSALDPFNTVYQSGNAVAPPSILNFSFELFFDRQEEAMDPAHPGVFVDYQFFDMVVRNVIPSDPNQTSNTLPDNGVMMVNPRDITVVFSPQLTVQGRPTNATVTFQKFTHRMTPVRMTIQLQILASYFGPVRDMVEYKQEEFPAEDSIPIDEIKPSDFNITFSDVDVVATGATDLPGFGSNAPDPADVAGQLGQANDANHKIRLSALQWAMNTVIQGGPGAKGHIDPGWTNYATADLPNYGTARHNLPTSADCSGLVASAYVAIGQAKTMGWAGYPGTATMISTTKPATSIFVPLSSIDWQKNLLPGDILIRNGHVAFFVGYSGSPPTGIKVFDAASSTATPEVGQHTYSGTSKFTHLIRPTPLGATSSAAQGGSYNSRLPF